MAKNNFARKVKKIHEVYNDGILYFGSIRILKNAKMEKMGESIEIKGKRPYANVTIRDNDNNVADSLGYTIDKKIRIPYSPLPENIKIKLDNSSDIYEVKKRDFSDNQNIYLYLQKATNKKDGV